MSDRPGVAVFDTNVLVSGFLSPHGAPGQIVEWLRSGAVRAGLDDRIISEYEEVLRRPECNLPRHEVLTAAVGTLTVLTPRQFIDAGESSIVACRSWAPSFPNRPFAFTW
jgi:hypothetical protein